MASSARDWDTRKWEWETPAHADVYDSDTEHEDPWTPERCGAELRELLIHLKESNVLSATKVCVISYWAKGAGAIGVSDLSQAPGKSCSSVYSRVFDKATGTDIRETAFYHAQVPSYVKFERVRQVTAMPLVLPHEAFADEVTAHWEEMSAHLASLLESHSLPPLYYMHPTVAEAAVDDVVWPLGLYLDGIEFARRDGAIGIWMLDILSGRRWLLITMRKSDLCKCGCKGYCSWFPFFQALEWSIQAMSAGKYPDRSHTGDAFTCETDPLRHLLAGKPLGRPKWKAAILVVKGDLMEYCTTLGFRNFHHSRHPCLWCVAPQCELFEWYSPLHRKRTWADYDSACVECERAVILDEADWRWLRASVDYDVRKQGSRGRALVRTLGPAGVVRATRLGLEAGDRLEPSHAMPDTGEGFDEQKPDIVTIWRPNANSPLIRRLPIFGPTTGIYPHMALGCDWLHCYSLGVFKYFNGALVWRLFEKDAWNDGSRDLYSRGQRSVQELSADYEAWVKEEADRGRYHADIDLSFWRFGTKSKRILNLYGVEANSFIAFAGHLLDLRGSVLKDDAYVWKSAVRHLRIIIDLIREHPLRFPDDAVTRMRASTAAALAAMDVLNINDKYKFHQMRHVADICDICSPCIFGCWVDEDYNQP